MLSELARTGFYKKTKVKSRLAQKHRAVLRTEALRQAAFLTKQMTRHSRDDEACRRLMTMPGVGTVSAVTFVATTDTPDSFKKSRSVGVYIALTSRRYQSGDIDFCGRISKRGDRILRTVLYEATNSLLCRVKSRPGQHLKDWAMHEAPIGMTSKRTLQVADTTSTSADDQLKNLCAAWVFVSGRNHGLGNAQSAVLAAVKNAGYQLLCLCLKRDHREIPQTGCHEHRPRTEVLQRSTPESRRSF